MIGLAFLSKAGKFIRQVKAELKKVNWPIIYYQILLLFRKDSHGK